MEHCSRYMGNGEGCFGIVWIENNGECWIRNSTTSTKNLVKSDGSYSALVVDGEMKGFNTTCPLPDKSIQSLDGVEGIQYTMNCNKAIGGFDACFQAYPACNSAPYTAFFHTATLEECLRICVDQHPLCKAVSWNPGLEVGFANCFPKSSFPETLSSAGAKQGIIHTATITGIDRVDATCPSTKTYTAQGNKKFDIQCGKLNTGTNITSIHTQNVTACMDACARSDKKCVGTVFDSTLVGGFKNCYLQNTTSTLTDQSNVFYASLSGSSPAPTSTSTPSSSPSKAWIAGPVIGALVALALLAFAIFWWRRKKSQQAVRVEKDGHEFGTYGAAPAYSPGLEGGTGHTQQQHQYYDAPVGELNGLEHTTNELPASTKYAHKQAAAQELPS
jgi:hypothetical protein